RGVQEPGTEFCARAGESRLKSTARPKRKSSLRVDMKLHKVYVKGIVGGTHPRLKIPTFRIHEVVDLNGKTIRTVYEYLYNPGGKVARMDTKSSPGLINF